MPTLGGPYLVMNLRSLLLVAVLNVNVSRNLLPSSVLKCICIASRFTYCGFLIFCSGMKSLNLPFSIFSTTALPLGLTEMFNSDISSGPSASGSAEAEITSEAVGPSRPPSLTARHPHAPAPSGAASGSTGRGLNTFMSCYLTANPSSKVFT